MGAIAWQRKDYAEASAVIPEVTETSTRRALSHLSDMPAIRGEQTAPPHADHAGELRAGLPVSRRMIVRKRRPSAVHHGHHGALAGRLEVNVDGSDLVRLEVDAAPLEREAVRRLPDGHLPHLEGVRLGRLEGLEQASTRLRLEEQLATTPTADAVGAPGLPPEIDLAREDVEGVLRRDPHEHRRARAITGRGHRLLRPRVRSACCLNAASSPAQNCSTSSSHSRIWLNGRWRRR